MAIYFLFQTLARTAEALSRSLAEVTRRECVGTTAAAISLAAIDVFIPSDSFAADIADQTSKDTTATTRNPKPFAPPEALLPAVRCKLWIDRAAKTAAPLSSTNNLSAEQQRTILVELNTILSHRPPLFLKNEASKPAVASGITAQITTPVSSANKEQYQQNRKAAGKNIGNQIAAILNQADVERQWGILQYEQRQRDAENEVRAALNYYTRQLQFDGAAFVLSESSLEQRKELIRNDAVPTLTATVTSDLDLRDLYRNQFLTALDDVTAEVVYQVKESTGSTSDTSFATKPVDCSDVVELMDQCTVALNKWFDLIDTKDVQDAVDTVTAQTSSQP